MDDGMVVGSTAVAQYHHHGGGLPRDSTDRGRCANLCFRFRRLCCCCCHGDLGAEDHACTAVVCRSVCTRIMLVLVNLAFVLAGWMMIALGIWIHIFHETVAFGVLFRDNPTGPILVIERLPITLIIIGGTVSVIGFLGCCGACTESVCFLGFYAVLLVLSFVAQIAIAVLTITFQKQIEMKTILSLQYQIRNEYNTSAKYSNNTDTLTYKVTKAWDNIQLQLDCCGAVGPQDYHNSLWFNASPHSEGGFVPQSCCPALLRPVDEDGDAQCQMEAITYINSSLQYHNSITNNNHNNNNLNNNNNNHQLLDQHRSGEEFLGSGLVPRAVRSKRYTATNGRASDQLNTYRVQGCHAAMVDWLSTYLPFVFVLLAVDILQLMNVIGACLLIGAVRRKQVDYSWCEDQDEVD